MGASKLLPPGYSHGGTIDLSRAPSTALLLLLGTGLVFPSGWLMLRYLALVRPEHGSGSLRLGAGDLPSLLLALISTVVCQVLLHEVIHGLFFWLFTSSHPVIGLKPVYAYAAAPDWYLPRNQYLVVGMAPLLSMTAAGMLLMAVAPAPVLPWLFLMTLFNAAGSVGDLAVVVWVLTRPASALVRDTGEVTMLYQPSPDSVPRGGPHGHSLR